MAYNELRTLTTFAMFDIRTVNTPNLESSVQHQLSMSSKSRFGVFVTLRRSETVFNLDDLDEKNQIHGCLGDWTTKYQSMTPSELTAKIQQLAHDVRFNDDRRNHFSVDVDQDASATIEINFMNLPLYEIDDTHEESRLINNEHGVLIDNGKGKRATFLPGVYPNASWNYISQSLRQKAGIGKNAAARFYAYDTTTVKFRIYETLFSPFSESHL